jgi:hypothetical protein
MKEMKMRGLSIFLFIVMVSTFIMVASNQMTLAAQEPPVPLTSSLDVSSNAHHILLSEDDFSEIGKAITVIAPEWVTKQTDAIPAAGLLLQWSESAATTLIVQFKENEVDNAIVNMSSYQFSSEKDAYNQLETINTSLEKEGVQILNDADLLDDETISLLTDHSTSWHIQMGKDDENLLTYFLWVQLDSYVIETQIAVEERNEQVGQQLLHHIIQQIFTEEALRIDEVSDTKKSDPPSVTRSWLNTTANSSLERSGIHFLAVWNLGNGNNQHFIGSGGDSTTCIPTHGCISAWTWWMNPTYGPSKLGVPKTFLLQHTSGWTGINYQATVWCC